MQKISDESKEQLKQIETSEDYANGVKAQSSEEYEGDNTILKEFTSKFHRKVPANKKKPIFCNNVITDYVEFNEEDFIKVYEQGSQTK